MLSGLWFLNWVARKRNKVPFCKACKLIHYRNQFSRSAIISRKASWDHGFFCACHHGFAGAAPPDHLPPIVGIAPARWAGLCWLHLNPFPLLWNPDAGFQDFIEELPGRGQIVQFPPAGLWRQSHPVKPERWQREVSHGSLPPVSRYSQSYLVWSTILPLR